MSSIPQRHRHSENVEHLGRDSGKARHWIFAFSVAAVLLMLFAKTREADEMVYSMTDNTVDKGEMLSNKQWDELHNTPEMQTRMAGSLSGQR